MPKSGIMMKMQFMTSSLNKYDVVVVKFPFADSTATKGRPVVIISNKFYNDNSRNSLLVLGISSKTNSKLHFEKLIENWSEAGLLKPSFFKSAIATVDKKIVTKYLGKLHEKDIFILNNFIEEILK